VLPPPLPAPPPPPLELPPVVLDDVPDVAAAPPAPVLLVVATAVTLGATGCDPGSENGSRPRPSRREDPFPVSTSTTGLAEPGPPAAGPAGASGPPAACLASSNGTAISPATSATATGHRRLSRSSV